MLLFKAYPRPGSLLFGVGTKPHQSLIRIKAPAMQLPLPLPSI
jgi:hypothetical protein